jgi:outer membrane protein
MKKTSLFLAAMAALGLCGSAFAQKAGSWSASIGFTQISPDVASGNLTAPSLPGTKVDVGSNSQITGAVNYMMTDNLAVHVPLGLGFKHDITGAGAINGVGKIATTKALPITVIAQYRFMDVNAQFRPYIGGGLSYVKFYKTQGTAVLTAITNPGGPATTLSFESKLAPTIQLGGTYNINEKWYVDASYTKTFIKTRGTLSTGQTLDATLDPSGYTLQVGYKF